MSEPVGEKLHVINLSFQNYEKRLCFVGEDSDEGQTRYVMARKGMNAVGDRCNNWPEFLAATIEHFKSFGFEQIKE